MQREQFDISKAPVPPLRAEPRFGKNRDAEGHIRGVEASSGGLIRATIGSAVAALPNSVLDRLPRSLSGGQRQRISIARALALDPQVLVCDEPLSALDVSVRAQIVNLFARLQDQLGLTIVIVAHDLAIVREVCSEVTVMYLGQVVEEGAAKPLFGDPAHPYSQALLSAVPSPDPRTEATRARVLLEGDPPSPLNPPPGCRFSTRCPVAKSECKASVPDLRDVRHGGRAACLLADRSKHPVL